MRLNLLYQFNEKYAPYAGVSILSALYNNRQIAEICVYILGEGITKESKEKIEKIVSEYHRECVYIDTDNLIIKMKSMDMPTYRGSYAANMRLFLDEVLEDTLDRVLYLDADTIVAGSLSKLIKSDMEGKAIGMVLDSLGESHKKQIGLSSENDYYNSGVILFDMKLWRECEFSKKLVKHIKEKRNNYPAPDQDLLNIICKNNVKRLDLRYNFQPVHAVFSDKQYMRIMRPGKYYSEEQIWRAREHICIYHFFRFVGEFPWHKDNVHPYNDIFDFYLQMSPWKEYRKGKANAGNVLKIEKILFKVLPRSIFLYVFKLAHKLFLFKSNKDSLKNKINQWM